MSTFHIQYHRQSLKVTQQRECHFAVNLAGQKIHLLLKQDNEGANHWFEEGKDRETEMTKEIGLAIEMYLSKA